ncbi:MAG: polysaccharide ABC transporter ATP-binding protein [Flavobacterium sp.]
MSTVIKAENISKQYRLGLVGTGTVRDDLKRWWHNVRGKEDPFLKIGEANNRAVKGESDYVWSLRDINFEINQGDSVGIIGRNGAGKSTLLKILSQVTQPTTGKIYTKGRIASLLEVGTGFHPEMTGRENIYLNGAILGMRKHEITRKLDEIIAFSGVERYIDTPVKRYSSGMYVRLAFAVAAHLESEILIVDEVLAVGDAEFQKKCLGKMNDVQSKEGRTVLFVSHNMAAVQNLCSRGILLDQGYVKSEGNIIDVTKDYLSKRTVENIELANVEERKGNGLLKFVKAVVECNESSNDFLETFKDIKITIYYSISNGIDIRQARIDLGINNYMGDRVAWLSSDVVENQLDLKSGKIEFIVKQIPLAPGDYNFNIYSEINREVADWLAEVLPFTIVEKDYYGTGKLIPKNQGNLLLNYNVE